MLIKFLGGVGLEIRNNRLDFGSFLDLDPGSIFSLFPIDLREGGVLVF